MFHASFAPFVLLVLLVPAAATLAASDRAGGYPRGDLLVETTWVARRGRDPGVRIIDLRDEASYAAGHIPGAVRLDEKPLRDPEDRLTYLPRPAAFAAQMAKAGIGDGTHVITYDDQGGKMAARLWYVLGAYGHEKVSLLNGGWKKWLAEKRPVAKETPSVPRAAFTPRATPTLSCPSPEVLARKPGVVILDARAPEEHAGKLVSPGAARAGRIPGSINVEWKENVRPDDHTFRPAAELKNLYAAKGVTPEKQIVVHCASGGRAAQSLFTLKLLGYPKVRVYYGSFSDYAGRAGAPVEGATP